MLVLASVTDPPAPEPTSRPPSNIDGKSSSESTEQGDCPNCIAELHPRGHTVSESYPATATIISQRWAVRSDDAPAKTGYEACRVISVREIESSVRCLHHHVDERNHASPTLVQELAPVIARRTKRRFCEEQLGDKPESALSAAAAEFTIRHKCSMCRAAQSHRSIAAYRCCKHKKGHRKHREDAFESLSWGDETQGDVTGASEVISCHETGEVPAVYVKEQVVALQYSSEENIEAISMPSTSKAVKATQRYSAFDPEPGPSNHDISSYGKRECCWSHKGTKRPVKDAFEVNIKQNAKSQRVEAPAESDEHEEMQEPDPKKSRGTMLNPYICPICKKTFSTQDDLRSHLPIHVVVKKYTCKMCPAHFCNHGALDHHMCQAHDIGARYNCEECGARFSQKQRLVAHARSHKNERPHRCGVCGVAFRRIENLREHMKGVHEGQRFHCTLCITTFSRSSHLNRHMKTIHQCSK